MCVPLPADLVRRFFIFCFEFRSFGVVRIMGLEQFWGERKFTNVINIRVNVVGIVT